MHSLNAIRLPCASELLDLWDAGDGASPAQRALLLVASAWPDECALDARPLGFINARLLQLRAALFGPVITCLANCASCHAELESRVPIDALLALGRKPSGGPHAFAATLDIDDGTRVAVRIPCIGDLLSLDGARGESGAALLARIVDPVTVGGTDEGGERCDPERLTPDACRQIERWVADADPLGVIHLSLRCPECSASWREPLHVVDLLWIELSHHASRLLREIARLAQAFGWSEADLLGMPVQRRLRYLALLES